MLTENQLFPITSRHLSPRVTFSERHQTLSVLKNGLLVYERVFDSFGVEGRGGVVPFRLSVTRRDRNSAKGLMF